MTNYPSPLQPGGDERSAMRSRTKRLAIAGLSGVGILDSLYMLAYHEGIIDSLICPFFGEGCNIVGRSRHAKHFGVPNALAGCGGLCPHGCFGIAAP